MNNWFGINEGLAAAGRLPALARERERISANEIVLLILCGAAAAAASSFIRLGLRLPGHSIVLSMIPMALGLALAPRRLSGFIMSASAFGTGAAFNLTGMAHLGSGAFISLCLVGPVMDLAVSKLRSGWKLYFGLILAGICTNLLALFSRGASKLLGLDLAGTRPFGIWWTQATMTYALSGALAGLIGALLFFSLRKQRSKSESADTGMPQVIFIGIDDTDIIGTPGTNQLARAILKRLGETARNSIICRHQLFFDPRVPYTSHNGSASIQLPNADGADSQRLIHTIRETMRDWFVAGSDPGLCITTRVTGEMKAFSLRCKSEVVTQEEARDIAARAGCHLEGLGGTEQGVIGALAAVSLAASGEDGRVIHLHAWPYPDDALCGAREIEELSSRGVEEVRQLQTNELVTTGPIDIGKHLRPNWRRGRIVLFVDAAADSGSLAPWRAVKLP